MTSRGIRIALNSASHGSPDLFLCELCELDMCHIRIGLHGRNSALMLYVVESNMDFDYLSFAASRAPTI